MYFVKWRPAGDCPHHNKKLWTPGEPRPPQATPTQAAGAFSAINAIRPRILCAVMPRIPVPPHPPVLGSSRDTKSSGPVLVRIRAHVENPMVIGAATEPPRGERSHAVGAHVGEGH